MHVLYKIPANKFQQVHNKLKLQHACIVQNSSKQIPASSQQTEITACMYCTEISEFAAILYNVQFM